MNKKVLSAILFGALMAGTGTFTSCIDNEEPASITTLRGAKAELLKAKAAVEQAKVAQVQAEAEVARAQAALLQAQAEAEAAKAESDKALAAAQIAEAQAKAEKALAEAEKARLEAEAAYQQSIIELKKAQAELVGKQATAIAPFVTAYESAIKTYNAAVDAQTKLERLVADQLAYVEEREADKEYYTRFLNKYVSDAESALAGKEAALEDAEATLAEAETLEAHEYEAKLEAVIAKMKEIDLAVIKLNVDAAEAIDKLYADGRFAEVETVVNEIMELKFNKKYATPAFELDLTGGILKKGSIGWEAGEATYNNILDKCSDIESTIHLLEDIKRDANDDAWTNEALVVLKENLKNKKEEVATAKKEWEEAVAAFNTNKYNTADPTKISGYTEVTTAMTAFNTAQTEVNAAWEAVVAASTKEADAKTMQDAIDAAEKVRVEAVAAAEKVYREATTTAALTKELAAILKPYEDAEATAKKAKEDAEKAVATAEAAYAKAVAESKETDPIKDPAVVAAAQTVVEKEKAEATVTEAYTKAGAALTKAKADNTPATLEAEHDKTWKAAYNAALAAEKTAVDAAKKAFNDKWDGEKGTAAIALRAANDALNVKEAAAEAAAKTLIEASETYNKNAGYDVIDEDIVWPLLYGEWDKKKGYNVRETIDTEKYLVLSKEAMAWVVIQRSAYLYGTGYEGNQYEGFEARLVEVKAEEIIAEIEAEHAEETIWTAFDFIKHCEAYGLMGEELAIAEKIRVVEFWLQNGKWIEEKIAALEEADKALHAIYDEATAVIAEKEEAKEELYAELNKDIEEAYAPILTKQNEMFPLQRLYAAYDIALRQLHLAGQHPTQTAIEAYISTLKTIVDGAKIDVLNAEGNLYTAQQNLVKWNSGAITVLEGYQNQLEDANTAVERASALMDAKRTQLEQAMSALEWEAAE